MSERNDIKSLVGDLRIEANALSTSGDVSAANSGRQLLVISAALEHLLGGVVVARNGATPKPKRVRHTKPKDGQLQTAPVTGDETSAVKTGETPVLSL